MGNHEAPGGAEQQFIYDPEQRRYNDVTTWLAEVLDGRMRTPFEYTFDGSELYADDGSPMKPVFTQAIKDAERITRHNPNLAFENRRRWIELQEYADMITMAEGNGPNTMIVVSDYPPELMDSNQHIGGYNGDRKITMLRAILRKKDGLLMYSQTLDGSNRQGLEAIYKELGNQPSDGELLGQRQLVDLSPEDQKTILDRLMGVYDRSLTSQCGGQWLAGRPPEQARNTYEFVCQQTDLLQAYTAIRDPRYEKAQLYELAAAMDQRFNDKHLPQELIITTQAVSNHQILAAMAEMNVSGQEAQAEGKVFSGCGSTLGAEQTTNAANQTAALGYGNQTNEKTTFKYNKYMYCVEHQAPPKKGEKKSLCGPCGICKTCTHTKYRNQPA